MTKDETGKLFTLLKQFYPNKNISAEMRLAWEIVFEPYAYEDVKAAAVAYVRKSKFFPDVADLTVGLAMQEEQPKKAKDGRKSLNEPAPWMTPHLLPDDPHSVSRYAREHGIRWEEAKRRMEEEI